MAIIQWRWQPGISLLLSVNRLEVDSQMTPRRPISQLPLKSLSSMPFYFKAGVWTKFLWYMRYYILAWSISQRDKSHFFETREDVD
jgi:hypothetical protein